MGLYWLIILSLITSYPSGDARYTEKQVVRYGKAIDVAKLDPTLSSQRLDEWLRFGPAHLDVVEFSMSSCDLKGDDSQYDGPLCIRFNFARGHVGGWGNITVGTLRRGIDGPPRLRVVLVVPGSTQQGDVHSSDKLSDLPSLMEKGLSYRNLR
jgi:hypothetical protein